MRVPLHFNSGIFEIKNLKEIFLVKAANAKLQQAMLLLFEFYLHMWHHLFVLSMFKMQTTLFVM